MAGVIAFPEARNDVGAGPPESPDASASRVIVLGSVLFHREALARALRAYDDIEIIGSVADVHVALTLAEARNADALLVDSPSVSAAKTLAAHRPDCKIVFVGAVGDGCRQLARRGAAVLVGPSSSLDEVHVALRFVRPHQRARSSSGDLPTGPGGSADPILTRREQEVRRLVARGHSNKEIADACGISIATVKNHVHRILGKFNFRRRAQIALLGGNSPL